MSHYDSPFEKDSSVGGASGAQAPSPSSSFSVAEHSSAVETSSSHNTPPSQEQTGALTPRIPLDSASQPTHRTTLTNITSRASSASTHHLIAAALQGDWRKLKDPATGKTYYYNAATQQTSWDLVRELGGEHSLTDHDKSTPASTVSTASYGPVAERQRAAREAPDLEHFQQLSQYVAFGAPSSVPSQNDDHGEASSSKDDEPVSAAELVAATSESHQFTPHDNRVSAATPVAVLSDTPSAPCDSPGDQPPLSNGTNERSKSTPASSSMFSTISQHLKPTPGTFLPVPLPTPGALPRASARASSSDVPDAILQPFSATPQPFASAASDTSQLSTDNASAAIRTGTGLPLATAKPLLPALPTPSLAIQSDLSKRRGAVTKGNVPSVFPFQTDRKGSDADNYSTDEGVPPLPQARMPAPPPADIAPKLLELRETSEAVERLVKAFALLRGHGPSPAAPPAPLFESSATDTLQRTSLHRVGADCTLKIRREARPSAPHLPTEPPSPDAATAIQANETLLEEELMTCVLELLEANLSKDKARQQLLERFRVKPQHEFVAADTFKYGGVPQRPTRQQDPHGIPGAHMPAFAGDEDPGSVLYYSVQRSLEKYLFRHVVDSIQPSRGPCHACPVGDSPITSYFACLILLDILSVCRDIVEHSLVDGTVGAPSPVLVRYDGERYAAPIARNAMHCLPFEALEQSATAAAMGDRTVFRMEYWVTRDNMFTIMEAVSDTMRDHIVTEANTAPYKPFAGDQAGINPRVLAPSKVPMFTLVSSADPSRDADRVSSQRGMHRSPPATPRPAFTSLFDVDQAGMEALAYAVSTMSTNILAHNDGAIKDLHDEAEYRTLTKLLAETVGELLEDTSIRASIERRTLEKFQEALADQGRYPSRSKREMEKAVIAKAEKEADAVVRRIMQEMLVRQAGV